MLGRLLAAQAELESQVAELRRLGQPADAGLIAQCQEQLGALSALQAGLATARGGDLALMKADVRAIAGTSAGLAQQARSAVATAAVDGPELAAVTATTRRELEALQTDLFGRRIFDPFLQFRDKEDEEAYRRREEETRRYIAQQMAANSAEGTLNAGGAMVGQMLDAQAHGAGESPEFLPRWNKLVETTRNQREAMRAEGRSTAEFDRNLADSVRRYLRGKGLSEAEIEAKLAVAGDPLAVVGPYLGSEREARELGDAVHRVAYVPPSAITVSVYVPQNEREVSPHREAATGVDDVMAAFVSAGVGPAKTDGAEPQHGIVGQIARASEPEPRR